MEKSKNNTDYKVKLEDIYIDADYWSATKIVELDNISLIHLFKMIRKELYKRGVFK